MKNIIIAYKAGSCGDFLSIPFIATNNYFSVIKSHMLNESGRMVPQWNDDFLKLFPKQTNLHHYARNWSNDLDKLSSISQPWLILCSDIEQATLLKNHFKDSVNLVTINYTELEYKFVLQSFCSKVLDYPNYLTKDDIGQNFLNVVAKTESEREYFLDLSNNKLLGKWYYDNVMNGNIYYQKEFYLVGDYEIKLSDIFNKNKIIKIITDIDNSIDLVKFSKIYDNWYSKQNLNW